METVRLQKILSRRGFGSRRECEKLISSNRVQLNGKTANLGDKADPETDIILVDGIQIAKERKNKIYISFNKPDSVLSETIRKNERKVITDFVKINEYLFIVGRLDYHSEGLILLTNDGELANRLTHPRYEHEKEYKVLISRSVEESQIKMWKNGVVLPNGYRTLPAEVTVLDTTSSHSWLKIIMREGKKRQIREVGKTIGLPVRRINRTRIGTLKLGNLKPGEWRYLSQSEIKDLKLSAGLT